MKQKEHYEEDMTRCLAAKTEEMKNNAARFETRIEVFHMMSIATNCVEKSRRH